MLEFTNALWGTQLYKETTDNPLQSSTVVSVLDVHGYGFGSFKPIGHNSSNGVRTFSEMSHTISFWIMTQTIQHGHHG